MPQPRKYQSAAERQRAYRARRERAPLEERAVVTPSYPKWRKSLREAYGLLEATYEEIHYWIQERSERWQESERAGYIEGDRDQLQEILEMLDNLSLMEKSR
jgi:hypothetical protein